MNTVRIIFICQLVSSAIISKLLNTLLHMIQVPSGQYYDYAMSGPNLFRCLKIVYIITRWYQYNL